MDKLTQREVRRVRKIDTLVNNLGAEEINNADIYLKQHLLPTSRMSYSYLAEIN